MASIILLTALFLYVLRFKPVQNYIAQKATAYLSKELRTTVHIKGLYIIPFKSLVIEDLLVLDLDKDTLVRFPELKVNINKFSINERILNFKNIEIKNGQFFLKDKIDHSTNLDFIIDYFDKPSGKPKVKKKKIELYFHQISFQNFNFKYKNLRYTHTSKGINFEDIDVKHLNGEFKDLTTNKHLFQVNISSLALEEKSGFILKKLSGLTTIDKKFIEVKNLNITTARSQINDYYRMDFKSFKADLKDYENKVVMTGKFKNSHISSHDIAYFAPSLKKIKLNIGLDGEIKGPVRDLRAKQLLVKAGKATFIKGDFNMKGLPNWDDTFMDMKIDLAGTNKKDLDELLTDISGKKIKSAPEIIGKFGNINFNGYFTGFANDFIAYGEFKTKLGRLKSDVNMKVDKKGTPSYTGNIKTYDFNIGELINEKLLGKLTSSLNIKGKGDKLETLKEELDGQVRYIDFKGYRYTNVNVKGTFEKKFFDGNLKIRDKNIFLDFDGSVNFNPVLPIVNFKANLKNVQLKTLNLYKDTLTVEANIKTNFSGKNLDNLQGQLLVEHIQLKNNQNNYHIDSIGISAKGIGLDRSLSINSDMLEASIHGQYDLNTIFSYFKSIAKTYIPSLQTKPLNFKTQIFDFRLKFKHFAPLANFLSPGLEVAEESMLTGVFNSQENTASLGGIIRKIKYKNLIANNIIIDQNTSKKQLTAVISSDQVVLNDSLFINNVNISNIVRNDSLALNIKLSNSNDINQLDLNGLVEFFPDTTKISILPSNLKINSEGWHIQDKVQIGFNQGKTKIAHFSLSHAQQEIRLDGIISKDPSDYVKLGIQNIQLQTFNPFLKAAGIHLGGTASGETLIYSALKSPSIKNNLKLDSLKLNKILIGNLKDTSSYNSIDKKAIIYSKILTDQKETLSVTGVIDAAKGEINTKIILDETKLIILSPFLNKLVSNLKGSVSADLQVTGKLKDPIIYGEIQLNKAQVTVNYLKTTYLINDKIGVNNAKLLLNNVVLKDLEGHSATANGSVDLKNINNPNIQVVVNANNLQALNTTSKDNSLYYGRAYGTGRFSFRGPTNDMFIEIDAKTEKGTVFNLPLNSSEKINEKEFITFVGKDTTKVQEKKTSFKGLGMSFKLDIDPNTTANIYTVLGKLSGIGNAELELNITKVGDFEMKGDYIIENGSFDFNARDIINKKFDIKQGGNIRWTGNPFNAIINLKATYSLRTPLTDLYKAANRETNSNANQNILTEVEMGLSNLLMKPDIKLDINFPSNPAIKDDLQTYFNDGNNLNKQALSLVIQRRFAPGSGTENLSDQIGSLGVGTASDLVFNQLNNVLSALNLNFVDINIRSVNDASASFKFFNDRIIVNAGITDINKTITDNTIGARNEVGRELEVLALIKKDGSLVAKVANKPPTIQSIFANPGIDPYKNIMSVGVLYSQQFDTFREFLQKITGKQSKESQRKNKNSSVINKEAILEQKDR